MRRLIAMLERAVERGTADACRTAYAALVQSVDFLAVAETRGELVVAVAAIAGVEF